MKISTVIADLVTSSADGHVSEARVWGHIGKGLLVYLIATHPAAVLASWEMLTAAFSLLIAPDLLKKYIAVRKG